MASSSPRASVVVPTRDRPAALARCLAALRRQEPGLEVVVVDDGSRDAGAVSAAAGGARVVRREGGGPAAARNAGVAVSEGEVILFCDDDCEPEPGWARALVATAVVSGVASGRTVAPPGAGAPVLASQTVIDALQLDPDRGAGEELAFAPTCNLACRKDVLERVRFDERFPFAAGEDRDFSDRLGAAGFAPVYEPRGVVIHHQEPGVGAMLRRQYRYGRGAAHYLGKVGARGRPAPGFRRRLLRRCMDERPAVAALAVAALAVAGQAATAAGYLRERPRVTRF